MKCDYCKKYVEKVLPVPVLDENDNQIGLKYICIQCCAESFE